MTALLVAIVIASAYMAEARAETVELMGGDPQWSEFFLRRLVTWGSWALFVEPVIWFARCTARWIGRWWLVLLVHVPLSLAFVPILARVQDGLTTTLLGESWRGAGPPWARSGAGGERPGERSYGERPPGEPDRRRWRAERHESRRYYARLLSYWAILGAGWTIHSHLRARVQERRASALEKDLVSAQLSNLRNQLHPHFLFNALHSVGGLIRREENDVAVDTLSALGSLLRAALDQERRQRIPLSEELELVERYLDVERQRLGDRLDVTIRVEAEASQAMVPSLVLLPLVENAIKYAVAPRSAGGVVEIAARTEAGRLLVEVCDDGPGFPEDVLSAAAPADGERVHIGLRNTRSRLAALHGSAARLDLSNDPAGGAVARLVLPLERDAREVVP